MSIIENGKAVLPLFFAWEITFTDKTTRIEIPWDVSYWDSTERIFPRPMGSAMSIPLLKFHSSLCTSGMRQYLPRSFNSCSFLSFTSPLSAVSSFPLSTHFTLVFFFPTQTPFFFSSHIVGRLAKEFDIGFFFYSVRKWKEDMWKADDENECKSKRIEKKEEFKYLLSSQRIFL